MTGCEHATVGTGIRMGAEPTEPARLAAGCKRCESSVAKAHGKRPPKAPPGLPMPTVESPQPRASAPTLQPKAGLSRVTVRQRVAARTGIVLSLGGWRHWHSWSALGHLPGL